MWTARPGQDVSLDREKGYIVQAESIPNGSAQLSRIECQVICNYSTSSSLSFLLTLDAQLPTFHLAHP